MWQAGKNNIDRDRNPRGTERERHGAMELVHSSWKYTRTNLCTPPPNFPFHRMAARALLESYSPQIGKSFFPLRTKWQLNVRLLFKSKFTFIVLPHLHAEESWQWGEKERYGPLRRKGSIWLLSPLYYSYQSPPSHKTHP